MLYRAQRVAERQAFARAVFLTIAGGYGPLGTKPWPKPEGIWEPRPREEISDVMLAQRRNRQRPLRLRHGPVFGGDSHPIVKWFNPKINRYQTNEV